MGGWVPLRQYSILYATVLYSTVIYSTVMYSTVPGIYSIDLLPIRSLEVGCRVIRCHTNSSVFSCFGEKDDTTMNVQSTVFSLQYSIIQYAHAEMNFVRSTSKTAFLGRLACLVERKRW